MEQYLNLWKKVKEILYLEKKIDQAVLNEMINPIDQIYKVENDTIYLIVNTSLLKFRINKFYLKTFNEALAQIDQSNLSFKVISTEEIDKERAAREALNPSIPNFDETIAKTRPLRPEYTFENFVCGNSNRFAFITALQVAQSPHVVFNPFYIFGDVGLGKTHLMMAIGHYILDKNKDLNLVYTTSTQFAEDYYLANTNSRKDPNSFQRFNQKYRSADILLIDDIQFLANKTATQEEFFKLFEHLTEKNIQIIITSDRNASELDNIMSRLISRFNSGVAVDIQKPDFEHRLSILKLKLSFLIPDPSVVANDALEYIASAFVNNVRDLEGALRRFVFYCVSFNYPFTYENAVASLNAIVQNHPQEETVNKDYLVSKIKKEVASYYKVSVNDITLSSRKKEFVYPRHIAIYLIRTLHDISLSTIGTYFNNRDHASIAHAFEKISKSLENDWTVKQDIENITKNLK